MYSLCKNNAISKVLNKLQVFHFRWGVNTNTTPTVITHLCVLQKPQSCNDKMVISLSLRFVDQIGTSVRFWPKKVKCWNFKGDCEQNGSTGKVATWGVLIYSWNMTFSYKMQNFFRNRADHLNTTFVNVHNNHVTTW